VAPVGQRAAAGLIDGGLLVGGLVAAMGAVAGGSVVVKRVSPRLHDRLETLGNRVVKGLESDRAHAAMELASVPVNIRLRNAQSPGMRMMHLHRADTRTGGPVTVRGVLIRQLFTWAWGRGARRIWRPRWERDQTATACCVTLIVSLAIQKVPILFTPRRQDLSDWVAGVVVLRD
jgi:uncharacterized RDD family membrane protein YckC